MKYLLFGRDGQVGRELYNLLDKKGELISVGHKDCDLEDFTAIKTLIGNSGADIVFNAAAYTDVDLAEKQIDKAFAINATAPGVMAEESAQAGALFVHFSTDYVFDGRTEKPYLETDAPCPINEYGKSKLAGEEEVLSAGGDNLILRTSWVYSGSGKNFYTAMRRLFNGNEQIRVVDDQFGAPTSAYAIASTAVESAMKYIESGRDKKKGGLYHATCTGETSWYRFAEKIAEFAGADVAITPVSSDQFVRSARRPAYSVLCSDRLAGELGIRLPSWEEALAEVVAK